MVDGTILTLLDDLVMPDLAAIDGSLTSLLDVWLDQSRLRALLQQRKWHDVLEQVDKVEESVHLILAQLEAYLSDIRSLAYQHSGSMQLAERMVLHAKRNAERSGDKRILGVLAVHHADILKNSARMEEARSEYEYAIEYFRSVRDPLRIAWGQRKLATLHLFWGHSAES